MIWVFTTCILLFGVIGALMIEQLRHIQNEIKNSAYVNSQAIQGLSGVLDRKLSKIVFAIDQAQDYERLEEK